jgi:hypothetical protein
MNVVFRSAKERIGVHSQRHTPRQFANFQYRAWAWRLMNVVFRSAKERIGVHSQRHTPRQFANSQYRACAWRLMGDWNLPSRPLHSGWRSHSPFRGAKGDYGRLPPSRRWAIGTYRVDHFILGGGCTRPFAERKATMGGSRRAAVGRLSPATLLSRRSFGGTGDPPKPHFVSQTPEKCRNLTAGSRSGRLLR